MNLTYVPIANLTPDQIVATTPILTAPYIYGLGPTSGVHSYFNELDNFFANSLFAHYTVEGLAAGVTIDQYGTITVDTLVPYIVPLTITATDDHGVSVTSDPLLFGFLNAPITIQPDGILSYAPFGTTSNILIGGLDSKIVGGTQSDFNFIVQGTIDTTPPEDLAPRLSFGSNLIVNATKSTTAEAYGNFKTILLKAQGADGITSSTDASTLGSIHHDTFEFKPNAFYVNGTVFGVAESLQIEARGGDNAVVNFDADQNIEVNNAARFNHNTINIGSQVIYGDGTGVSKITVNGEIVDGPGALTGIFKQIIINVTPGAPKTEVTPGTEHSSGTNIQNGFNLPSKTDLSSFTGSIDTSSSVQDNTFTFGTTQITIQGDSSSQTSTINANVHDLIITAKSIFLKDIGSNFTNITTATFKDNHFIFGDAELKGDQGGVNFFGHLYNFGDAFDYTYYRGFVKGVTVTNEDSHLTIKDANNNTITWGNNTYTGGLGADTYNFAIIEDTNHYAVMQGFDTIKNFDLNEDKIVFNLERNLFRRLGMNDSDDQRTLVEKLDQNVVLSPDGQGGTIITFKGPLNSEVSFGHLELDNIGTWANLKAINDYYFTTFGINPIQIISTGPGYTPPTANPEAINTFDPVFVKINQVQAFANFVSNADLESLTWGTASGTVLPPGISFTSDGTLHVFETSNGKTPIDAFIQVTVHDDEEPTNIITLPSIHIFALNADSGAPFRDASIKGSIATEIYETTGAQKIVGGGDDIIYNPATKPTTPGDPLIYGSKLIYDISEGGHEAIGDVERIQFTNTGTPAASNLDGQTITFRANMFNINSGGIGFVFGNAKELILSANGGHDSNGNLINATINNNIFNFGPNTIYTVGSTTTPVLSDVFTAYGVMQTLTLSVHNPDPAVTGTIGNANITGNIFNFGANKLVGSSDNTILNPGIGVLNIINTDTTIHDPLTPNPMPISGNTFTFGNSTLIGGTGSTVFNADIADLSNTDFVKGIVTLRNDATSPVQVADSQNNVITWGNNTYTILSGSQGSTLNFTLLSLGGNDAAMQGNAKIEGFRLNTDALNLKLAPLLFKSLNTNYDRSISLEELNNPQFTTFDNGTPGKTTLSFAPSLAAGSITFIGQPINSYTDFSNLTTELAYTQAPITVRNPALGLTPQIFLTNGGNGAGVYGNVLDNYFDHLDIGDAGSTYTVTLSTAYPQFINSGILLSVDGSGTLFDQYGTLRVENAPSSPTLSIINVAPHDVHNLENTVNVDLVVGTFDNIGGVVVADPNTAAGGVYTGSLSAPSYLQGNFADETLIGNANQLTVSALNQERLFGGATYGADKFGGNMIINTSTGNTAYGVAKDIIFSAETSSIDNATNITGEFNFGGNAIYTNGTVFGVANKFLIDARNTITGSYSASSLGTSSVNAYAHVADGRYNFGGQTIFGQGTLIGALGLFQITTIGNTTASITDADPLTINAFTEVRDNVFSFAPTEIIVLGSDHSSIFTQINSLSFFMQHGTFFNDPFLNQTLNAPAVIENNTWSFGDSIAVGGSGGIDYYSDINDMSNTSFWSSENVTFNNVDSHIAVIDNPTGGFVNIGNNTIIGGNNKVYLSTDAGSPDTIHLNVLQGQNGVGLLGNLDVYNFNPMVDTVHFNISIPMYKFLNGGSMILNGLITANDIDSYASVSSGTDTTINFAYGSLTLHGVSGYTTVESLPHIQVGTTLIGNQGVSDGFTIGVPTDFSNFKEVDHIAQFNPNQDVLRFALSSTTYAQMSKYGWVSNTDLLDAFVSNVGSNITITQKPMEYESVDSTNTSAATVDSTLNFGTSGSITLHNVDMTTLNSSFVQLGQQGTNVSDTFYFMVPGNDFSTFTGGTFITGFNNTGTLNQDILEITVSKDLYNAITQNGTLSAADALSAHVANSTGGIITTSSGGNTILQFVTNNAVHGTITLDGINSTLAGLGSYLHLGYIDSATTGVDTFAFNVGGSSFDTFSQFAHITNFDPTQDIIQITVPVDLYYTINTEGSLTGQSLYNKLAAAAAASMGGITTTSEAAHYSSPQYGTGNSDFILNFQSLGESPSGIITFHNVDGATSLMSLGNHFQFGSLQAGTAGIDTFSFNAPANGAKSFSAFQQFNHISNFELGTDNIDITLPLNLFNAISNDGKLSSAEIADALAQNTTKPALGDINVISANGSTSLQFVDNFDKLYGSITLDGVTLAPGADINSFGNHLRFGSVQQGTSGADTFTFDHAANGNSQGLSAFKEFDHLIDFDTGADTLIIKITNGLYNEIDSELNGHIPLGNTQSDQLAAALDTGMVNGQSIGTQITVAHTSAQYGTGVDSILQFMTNGVMSGSITLHNTNINSITEIPNLIVTH